VVLSPRLFVRSRSYKRSILVIIPLALCAFTHLWNPIGFPGVHYDEAIYTERAARLLEGLSPQDPAWRYDHPFFGQILLGSILSIIGYPDSLHPNPSGDNTSVENLYLIPRVLMGGFAIIDTFLIYKICERRYNRNIAIIASVLFAVMPMSWLIRRIFLESIQLPLLLSSILFAVYSSSSYNEGRRINKQSHQLNSSYHNVLLVLLSGIFLGLAIFTKIPAFSMIPVVGFVIFMNNKKSFRTLGMWLIPVILIPAIWAGYAMSIGELDKWFDIDRGVLWQTQRETRPIWNSIDAVFEMDPVLAITGIIGTAFTVIWRKDIFPILWIIPLIMFLYFIQFASYWHFIPIIPILCIASAILIVDISRKITNKDRVQQNITSYFRSNDVTSEKRIQQYGDFYLLYLDLINTFRPLGSVYNGGIRKTLKLNRISSVQIQVVVTAAIAIFGLISTTLILSLSVNFSYFSAIAYLVKYLPDPNTIQKDEKEDITIIGSPRYFWIPRYIFDKDYFYKGYTSTTPVETSKNIIVADRGFRNTLSGNEVMQELYNDTSIVAGFSEKKANYDVREYPYSNMKFSYPDPRIEVRSNYR
jgi:hypothetical protein